jgi:type II secretory pathway component PulK
MKRRTTRPAFVTTLAVMMIALVAVALAALTTRIGTAARQATAAREQAQVEQLVLAGLQIAAEQTADVDKDIPLPKELAEAGVKLRVTIRAKHVAIEAQYGRARMTHD